MHSVERLVIARERHGTRGEQEHTDGPEIRKNFRDLVALEQDAAEDAQEVSQRQDLAQPLRPLRHSAERKHETGKKYRWQKEEDLHLHRLQLVLGPLGKSETYREIRRDENHERYRKEQQASHHRNLEQQLRDSEDDDDLDVAYDDVAHDFSGHHLDGAHRGREQI